MHRVAKEITATVTVTGLRRFNVRCAVGMWLLRLAAWVLPVKTEIETRS
jgi:hypothetical protein